MIEGLSVASYVLLIDFTGRLFRDGKAVISAEVAGILERLGSNAESWWTRIEKLSNGRLLGRFFAVNRQRFETSRGVWVSITWQIWRMPGAMGHKTYSRLFPSITRAATRTASRPDQPEIGASPQANLHRVRD